MLTPNSPEHAQCAEQPGWQDCHCDPTPSGPLGAGSLHPRSPLSPSASRYPSPHLSRGDLLIVLLVVQGMSPLLGISYDLAPLSGHSHFPHTSGSLLSTPPLI